MRQEATHRPQFLGVEWQENQAQMWSQLRHWPWCDLGCAVHLTGDMGQ